MIKIDGETFEMSGSSRELLRELAIAVSHYVQLLVDESKFSFEEVHEVAVEHIGGLSLALGKCRLLPDDEQEAAIKKIVSEQIAKRKSRP